MQFGSIEPRLSLDGLEGMARLSIAGAESPFGASRPFSTSACRTLSWELNFAPGIPRWNLQHSLISRFQMETRAKR